MTPLRQSGPPTAAVPAEWEVTPEHAGYRAPDASSPAWGLAWGVALSAPFWALLAALIRL